MRLKGYNIGDGGGEIVEVQGGHIIRATGRKDRHSKVFTSKGPRDRRVRLSALTAIQFYDVQDRLGYDRPSKAVDWLLKKAQSAIDKLETSTFQEPGSSTSDHNQTQSVVANLDHEEAMKTFFPVTSCSNMNFQIYPYDNTTKLSQDLGLSLHPFQGNNSFTTTTPFETFGRISAGWNHHDLTMSEQQESSNGVFMVNQHQQPSMMTLLSSQQQQRGTLQSSLCPHSFCSWDHHHHHNRNNQASSSQFGSHGMMMMQQGLSFPNMEEATQPNSSSSPTPN